MDLCDNVELYNFNNKISLVKLLYWSKNEMSNIDLVKIIK